MGVLSLSKQAQSLGPERDALALAINAVMGHARDVAKAKNVVERARDLQRQAQAVYNAASAAANSARDDHRAAVLHSAQTGEAVKATSVTRDLRHALDDAKETLDAAEAAVETAEAAFSDAEHEFNQVHKAVASAADAVIATAASEALDRCRALEREHFKSLVTLRRIEACMGPPNRDDDLRWSAHTKATSIIYRSPEDQADRKQVDALWDASREALLRDASAPLPDINT